MRIGFFVGLAGMFLAAGLASAQTPAPDGAPAPVPLAVDAPEATDPATRLWGQTDFLVAWIKGAHTPPLVTSGPAGSGGILGQGGVTLFGGSVDDDALFGGRFELGYWLDDGRTFGVEGDYFFLGPHTVHFNAGSNGAAGTPVIARPFFNVNSQAQDSELIADPGLLQGAVGVALSDRLEGAELNGVCRPFGCDSGLEFLAGFRYLYLREELGIDENLLVLPGVPTIGGDAFGMSDQFGASNHFYGGQAGAKAEIRTGNWFFDLTGLIALGDTHQTVRIDGATVITPAGGPATTARGGLLALPSNIGSHSRDEFGFVPEVGFTVGYQPIQYVRIFAGYTFIYWSDVVRAGDQVNYAVNPTQLPANQNVGGLVGPAQPSFAFHGTDFWVQGIQLGAEFRY